MGIYCIWIVSIINLLIYAHAQEPLEVSFAKLAFEHKRGYLSNPSEYQSRLNIFVENVAIVHKLNSMESQTAFFSVENQFFDWSFAEFRVLLLRGSATHSFKNTQHMYPSNHKVDVPTPSSFDWREKGAVTPVKNQGALGTCWAFSAMANLEGQLFLTNGILESLSVEQLLECDNSDDSSKQIADCGVFGGWPFLAFQYLMNAGGVRTDESFPYCAGYTNKSQCWPCMAKNYSKSDCGDHSDFFCNKSTTLGQRKGGFCSTQEGVTAKVSGWAPVSKNETIIAEQLVSIGPLSVAFNAEGWFQFYKSGVYNPKVCDPQSLDHAVLIVGFGVDTSFGAYWTVKNSWGANWGENGYFRIARGSGTCGINQQVCTGYIQKS